jgi:hypothetical protein
MEQKHSRLGLASFITSIGAVIYVIALWYIIVNDNTYMYSLPPSKTLTIARTLCALSPVVLLAALVLGIVGALQKDRKNIFAILGIIVSAMTIVIIAVIFVILMLIYGVW